jgi:hypothetical protein
MRWRIRTLASTDWSLGGFAAEVMWTGTDNRVPNSSGAWVEVGVTHGFGGQSLFRYYTARQTTAGPGSYLEAAFTTKFPSVGNQVTFSVYSSAGGIYNASVTDTAETATRSWTGHQPFTIEYSGGLEVTCTNTARVDRTFVDVNQFRRASDLVWVDINSGSLVDQDANGGIAWCTQPRTFRYYHRSATDPSQCF